MWQTNGRASATSCKLACLARQAMDSYIIVPSYKGLHGQALCGQMPFYLADDIHLVSQSNRRSLRSSSDNMCVVPRTHNSFEDRNFGEFGTVCRAAYGHLTSATNILRRCWRQICFDKATALCDILYKRLRNILTYLLTYLLTYSIYSALHTMLSRAKIILHAKQDDESRVTYWSIWSAAFPGI